MTDIRPSVRATYDSEQTGWPYHVTATVNGRPLAFQHRIPDPFVRQTVRLGWLDLLRGLLRPGLVVEVTVGADREVAHDVLELDEQTLIHGRNRQAAFRQSMHQKLRSFATYLTATERDQLDARAAAAEQERDEALEDRDGWKRTADRLATQLDEMREARDVLRHRMNADVAAMRAELNRMYSADMAKLRAELGAALTPDERQSAANGIKAYIRLCGSRITDDHPLHTIAAKLSTPPPGLGSPPARAQDDVERTDTTGAVLYEVARERSRQDAKWGEQNHPDADEAILGRLKTGGKYGTPEAIARRLAEFYEIPTAGRAKFLCEKEEPPTWVGIAIEEMAEVLEASTGDPAKLRAEWVQLAAVAVAAVEAIDRRPVEARP